MSDSRIYTKSSVHIENEKNRTKKQERLDRTVRIRDITDKSQMEGETNSIDSKSFTCIDIENTIEPPADKKEEIPIDVEKFVDLSGLKIHVVSRRAPKRVFTVMGLYDSMFGRTQQEPEQRHRYNTRQLWRQEMPPPQQQQTVWTQFGQGQTYHGYDGYGAYGYDGRGPLLYEPRSRNSFVGLVMGIVFVMLFVTAIFLGVVLSTPDLKHFFHTSSWLILLPAIIGLVTVNCAMICSPCARRPPCNFVCLIIATASMSLLAAKITSHYKTEVVFHAVLATGAVAFVCVLLACSKFDFTSYLLYIVAIATAFSVIVMIILISMMITGNMMKPVILVVLIIGTLIQIVMLTMQLQMILGGKTIEISEADYALAAFLIYTSILDIFLKLVHILGILNN